jgi:hypothetical protein
MWFGKHSVMHKSLLINSDKNMMHSMYNINIKFAHAFHHNCLDSRIFWNK